MINKNNYFKISLSLLLVVGLTHSIYAQEENTSQEDILVQEAVLSSDQNLSNQLDELSLVIQEKNKELSKLKSNIGAPGSNPELDKEMATAIQQLDTLNKSFEQLAIGYINLDEIDVNQPELTWQEELTLAVKPLLENLRGLTEQPRKRENLRQQISSHKATKEKAGQALLSIGKLLENDPSASQQERLKNVQNKWLRVKENAEQEQQLALYQLESLTGVDNHWFVNLKKSTVSFFQDRGLTIALAFLVSILIWLFLVCFRKLIDRTGSAKTKHTKRTTYRIIAYMQRLLTIVLIIIGVLTVFFIRGDILLLIITLALLFAGALGLKNFLPQFISESKLLLNIGSVREYEQVLIDGVPWRVATINIYSKLTNPEIQGTLRLPIADLKNLVSRPIKEEKWFPSSIGDWVVDADNKLYEVIKQTPVVVELQSAQGTNKLVPTPTYFSAGFVNLSKSKHIRITSTFGVSYELQSIALSEVPKVFEETITKHLLNASLDTDDIDVRVEFSKAGESSLDYLVIANINSIASKYYYRIERVIQQACLEACNTQDWGIPFPQLTIHHSPS